MPIVYGVAALLVASGYFVDKSGEGVNDLSNGALKLVVGGAITFIVLKKTKVI